MRHAKQTRHGFTAREAFFTRCTSSDAEAEASWPMLQTLRRVLGVRSVPWEPCAAVPSGEAVAMQRHGS